MASFYSVPESSKRVYLCYLLRLKHLIQRYAWVVWRILRREETIMGEIAREERVSALMDWLSSG